jgi:hypothetical protein
MPATPEPSMLARGRASKGCALALALSSVAVAACGGFSAPKVQIATRVCRGDLNAVRKVLGAVRLRIADSDPANIECVLSGDGLRLDVVAEASPRAWTQFDTLVVHAVQAPVPNSVHQASNLPRDLPGLGYSAAWNAGGRQLLATNGTQSTGGSFVTITVRGSVRRGSSDLTVARVAATATLAAAPRGPSPGPPPS